VEDILDTKRINVFFYIKREASSNFPNYKGGNTMKETLCTTLPECNNNTMVSVTIDVPTDLLERVQEAASLEGTEYQSLMTCYIHVGTQNSKADVKRLQFAEQARRILVKHGVKDNAIEEIFKIFPY